jgi:hypothetical protein
MPWADSNTICARRQVTTEPVPRRTIRSSRLPSSGVISRSTTLAAIFPSQSKPDPGNDFGGEGGDPVMETGERCRSHH